MAVAEWIGNTIVKYARSDSSARAGLDALAASTLSPSELRYFQSQLQIYDRRALYGERHVTGQGKAAIIQEKFERYFEQARAPPHASPKSAEGEFTVPYLLRVAKEASNKKGRVVCRVTLPEQSPWVFLNWDLKEYIQEVSRHHMRQGRSYQNAMSVIERLYLTPISKVTPRYRPKFCIKRVLDLYLLTRQEIKTAAGRLTCGPKTLEAIDHLLMCNGLPRIESVVG